MGVIATSLTTGLNTDVCNFMFGSILAMNKSDVVLSIIVSIIIGILFIIYYRKLFAVTFDEEFAKVLLLNQIKAEKLLTIDRENERPRKDIAHYSEVKNLYSYMFNEYFDPKTTLNFDSKFKKSTILKFLNEYLLAYSPEDDKQEWFDRLKTRAADCGFVDMKTYKANPEMYEGNVADASNILRVALTGKTNTQDLYEIMKVLGTGEIRQRLQYVIQKLK